MATLVGLVLTAVGGGLLARYLSRPIHELQQTAHRLTDGDLSARAHVVTGDELEALAGGLNAAAAALGDQVGRVSARRISSLPSSRGWWRGSW